MSIEDAIKTVQSLEDLRIDDPLTVVFKSSVLPSTSHDLSILNVQLPDELVKFWKVCNGIELFCDQNYGQWGLILFSPQQILSATKMQKEIYEDNILETDIVIGKLKGDSEFPILRCDPTQEDFGHIIIGMPAYSRNEWSRVANSLEEFIHKFIESPLKIYWE